MQKPEIGQLLRRVVPLESGFFATNWCMVNRNLYLPLTTSVRIKQQKTYSGAREEAGEVSRATHRSISSMAGRLLESNAQIETARQGEGLLHDVGHLAN